MGSIARQSAARPTSCSRRSAQVSGTDHQNVQCKSRGYCERVNDSQQFSQLESMGERRLPRAQKDLLLPRVRKLPRRRRRLSLRGRLHIALWITGRGVSHLGSPGDQSMRVLLTCRNVETDWTWRGMQEVCRMLDGAARRIKRGHKNKEPETELERRHCPVAANKFAPGEGVVSCPACARLPARNGLVNKV